MRSLAAAVGRSPSAVRKWVDRQDWPFGKLGPWDVEQVKTWMQLHLKRDPAQRFHDAKNGIGPRPLSEIDAARKVSFEEQAAFRRVRRQQLEGKLHDVEACRSRRLRQVLALRNTLTRTLPRSVAAECVGKARGDVEQILRRRLTAVCDAFANAVDEEGHE